MGRVRGYERYSRKKTRHSFTKTKEMKLWEDFEGGKGSRVIHIIWWNCEKRYFSVKIASFLERAEENGS